MPRAVRFSRYGGPEVLDVAEVGEPVPAAGEVVVAVEAATINPGEIGIREGAFADLWPARFPEGQGNDYAGTVDAVRAAYTRLAERHTHGKIVLTTGRDVAVRPAPR